MKSLRTCFLSISLGIALASPVAMAARVSPVTAPPGLQPLEAHSPGRVLPAPDGDRYQWPGLYFEARFEGKSIFFEVGPGDVILRVLVDGAPVATLVKPAPGYYEIGDLARGKHAVRIEALTESQAAPNTFGGFRYSKGTRPLHVAPRARQIEFIGDSHTVGYGNTSSTRKCSREDVWRTTDDTQAFGAKLAQHYGADYQVNAISGRGIVRNYGGGAGATLPQAYPYTLLDDGSRYEGRGWHPRLIVIALGTNDFSTQLGSGESWKSRDELHADFEQTYLRFLATLRARNPEAFMVVWATDMADGEIEAEVGRVVKQFQSSGDTRITFLPIHGLAMTGCDWHPSVADDDAIATALMRVIDGTRDAW